LTFIHIGLYYSTCGYDLSVRTLNRVPTNFLKALCFLLEQFETKGTTVVPFLIILYIINILLSKGHSYLFLFARRWWLDIFTRVGIYSINLAHISIALYCFYSAYTWWIIRRMALDRNLLQLSVCTTCRDVVNV
jgi:hypothetical protein